MAKTMSGDRRNPDRIRAWATDLARVLPGARPGIAIDPPARSLWRFLAYGVAGWALPVWDHNRTSIVRLCTREAIVQKIAYTLANPVAAGLVQFACDWPGAKVLVDDIGCGELRAKRPDVYFNPKNPKWSYEATLPIALPPGIQDSDADRFREEVAAELKASGISCTSTRVCDGWSIPWRGGSASSFPRSACDEL